MILISFSQPSPRNFNLLHSSSFAITILFSDPTCNSLHSRSISNEMRKMHMLVTTTHSNPLHHLCLTLFAPLSHSTPSLPSHHILLPFTKTETKLLSREREEESIFLVSLNSHVYLLYLGQFVFFLSCQP
jgi:hypothetical protein